MDKVTLCQIFEPDLLTLGERVVAAAKQKHALIEDALRVERDRLQLASSRALAKPEFQKRLTGLGAEPVASTPAELAEVISKETAPWAALVKSTGTKLD